MIPKRSILILGVLAAALGACGVETDRPDPGVYEAQAAVSAPAACATANEGCPCADPDEIAECQIKRQSGDYVTCSPGFRVCSNGKWSECIGDEVAGE